MIAYDDIIRELNTLKKNNSMDNYIIDTSLIYTKSVAYIQKNNGDTIIIEKSSRSNEWTIKMKKGKFSLINKKIMSVNYISDLVYNIKNLIIL